MGFKTINIEALKKAILDGLRVILIGIYSFLLTEAVVVAFVDLVFGVQIDPALKIIIVGFITSILKSVDKWLHETGIVTTGITGF